jgi:hypothetical protein
MEAGWMAAGPMCIPVILDECTNAVGVDFYNVPLLCIEGTKIDDSTGEGLAGWTIDLYDAGGALIASTTTDVNGDYSFCGLEPGDYTVCEILQAGWINVTPLCIPVTLVCDDSTGNDFLNTPPGDEGCTPGFWKNNAKNWGAVAWYGYTPGDWFDGVFGCGPHITLLAALELKGGGENALIRHAVAALLNAESPWVAYATSSANIISSTCAALASGDKQIITDQKDEFDMWNNAGCSVDQHGDPIINGG